jgi:diguanylate cyclase (GGDEF)-like protein
VSIHLVFDNRTLTTLQVGVSVVLFFVMLIAWRTQTTYPGFGRWTMAKAPHAIGFLLVSLRGIIPDWISVIVANALMFVSPILLYEGIRQFCGKNHRDTFNYGLMIILLALFNYFFWIKPSMAVRLLTISVCTTIIVMRCSGALFYHAPRELRASFHFTSAVFGLYAVVLWLRIIHGQTLFGMAGPLAPDLWQSLMFMGTIIMPIGWTFGFFMMTNARLTFELRAAEAECREMAATDYLTGALNRRSFVEIGRHETRRAKRLGSPLALLMMDIDHFKSFNDTYGHPAGDEILCAIVTACRENLREVDIFARWGGEELVALLPDTNRDGALHVAEKLRRVVLKLSIPVGEERVRVTISIGAALRDPHDADLEDLLQRADVALYKAKQKGRNCVAI